LLNLVLAALLTITTLIATPGIADAQAPADPQVQAIGPPDGGNEGACVADVLFILDRSGSMGWSTNGTTGIAQLRAGFKSFLNGLSDGSKIGVVDFATSASKPYGNTWKVLPSDRATLDAYVDGLTPDGLTNWEDALGRGGDIFSARPVNSTPAVAIFITDGNPTTSNTGADDNTFDAYRDVALDEANALKTAISATGGKVIGIGAGANISDPTSQARLLSVVDQLVAVADMGDLAAEIEKQLDTVCAPVIGIDKTATPTTLPEPGGDVDYTITVTNNSSRSKADVHLTSFTDDNYGDFPGNAVCKLNGVGASVDPLNVWVPYNDSLICTWTETATFQNREPGFSVTNTASATGEDPKGRQSNSPSASATVTITDVPSSIKVTKTAVAPTSRPEPGGTFTFDVTIENTSKTDSVQIEEITDDPFGTLTGTNAGVLRSSCTVPQRLVAGGIYRCNFEVDITGDPGTYGNEVPTTTTPRSPTPTQPT